MTSRKKNNILVAYASRAGSTAEVAQAIGRTLIEQGMEADIVPVEQVTNLTPYQAVVVGSAIRAAHWLPEAMKFMQGYRVELARKPFAMFTVCITLAMSNSEQYRAAVREWTAPVRALVTPCREGLFAGMLDFKKLPLNFETLRLRATVAMGIFPKDDRRDWNAIRSWAESLKPMLDGAGSF